MSKSSCSFTQLKTRTSHAPADCKQTSVRVQSLISSVEITGSTGFKLELTGFVPTIQLNSTDSGQIYLSKDSLDVEILTTKCVGISVNLSVGGEEAGLYREQAIMETLKTVIKDGKLSTTVVKHAGWEVMSVVCNRCFNLRECSGVPQNIDFLRCCTPLGLQICFDTETLSFSWSWVVSLSKHGDLTSCLVTIQSLWGLITLNIHLEGPKYGLKSRDQAFGLAYMTSRS